MPSAGNWSSSENEVVVRTYLRMLKDTLEGRPTIKKREYEATAAATGRSPKSVERKMQNISAVLHDERLLFLPGLAPAFNYQSGLATEVLAQVADRVDLFRLMGETVNAPTPLVASPFDIDFQFSEVPVTVRRNQSETRPLAPWRERGRRVDFVAQEARNRSLGTAGEHWVMDLERSRLTGLGRPELACKVEHVAKMLGDGPGFDVLSFDTDGRERYIEVKTTTQSQHQPFYATANEVRFSQDEAEQFSVYRVFDFTAVDARVGCYRLPGALSESCRLTAMSYQATPTADLGQPF